MTYRSPKATISRLHSPGCASESTYKSYRSYKSYPSYRPMFVFITTARPQPLTLQMPELGRPLRRQSHHFHVWEFDHDQHLPAGNQ
jgi:hypothetical protein